MPTERIITSQSQGPEEAQFSSTLRPRNLDEWIGQDPVIDQIHISLTAAKQRKEPLDHLLLSGPPGLGKTTLANIISTEMGASMRSTSGPAIVKPGDLMSLLTTMERGDVLFIDEIHRLSKVVEEFLYPAMQDFRVDFTIDSGLGGRPITFNLKQFTLIGATTRKGMLGQPFLDRFGIDLDLQFYSSSDLAEIIARAAQKLPVEIEPEALTALSSRSRGTPRVAIRLLKRVRDYAQVRADGVLNADVVLEALDLLGVDGLGLDHVDRDFLTALIKIYEGGPAGIQAIAASLGRDRDTLEDVVEPFLLQRGLVRRTHQGREATPDAYDHLGLPPNHKPRSSSSTSDDDPTLF
jgi:Holliday junction DNA helicase RuvB